MPPFQRVGVFYWVGVFYKFLMQEHSPHRRRISKLVDYKGTKIRGYQAPLTVTGPPELLRIGYTCGFGDRWRQGTG